MTDELRKELTKLYERAGLVINYDDDCDPTGQLIHETLSLFTTHTTALLKKIEGELPKQTMGAPVGIYETGSECGAYADGYNAALSDVQSIINKYKGE